MQYKNKNTKNRRRYKTRYKTEHNYRTKRSVKSSKVALVVGISTFVILAALILIFVFGDSIFNFFDSSFKHLSTTATLPVTESIDKTEESTKAEETEETKEKVTQSDDFVSLCDKAEFDVDDSDAKQVIFVACDGTKCSVSYYQSEDGKFSEVDSDIDGYISPSGTAKDMGPSDDYTPLGNFNIEFAFGTASDPGTSLEYDEVNETTLWITDPASVNYNRMVSDYITNYDFNSCINLIEYSRSYKYAVVFDYNRNPVDSSKGCAKFLHVGTQETYGGVGIPEDDLLDILDWLDPNDSPVICIYND